MSGHSLPCSSRISLAALLLMACSSPSAEPSGAPELPEQISAAPCPSPDRVSITPLAGVDSSVACHLTGYVLGDIGMGGAMQSGLMSDDSAKVHTVWVEYRVGPDSGVRPPAGPSWVLELAVTDWPFSFEARVDAATGVTVVMPWPDRVPSHQGR